MSRKCTHFLSLCPWGYFSITGGGIRCEYMFLCLFLVLLSLMCMWKHEKTRQFVGLSGALILMEFDVTRTFMIVLMKYMCFTWTYTLCGVIISIMDMILIKFDWILVTKPWSEKHLFFSNSKFPKILFTRHSPCPDLSNAEVSSENI